MFSSFWLLAVASRDLSQAEEEITAFKTEADSQNDNYFHSK